MLRRFLRRHPQRWIAAAIVTAGTLAAPLGAAAQSAEARYESLLATEEATRANSPSIASLRALAKSYEGIPRAYPRSGYSDNALWQAAGLLLLAYERTGNVSDRDKAREYLTWLRREYPSGRLARQVPDRLAAIDAGSRRAPTPAPMPVSAASRSAQVLGVTHVPLPKGDRITIELEREVLVSSARIENPDRVLLTLSDASSTAGVFEDARLAASALVTSLAVTNMDDDRTEVALDLTGDPRLSMFWLYEPARLVIDVEGSVVLPAMAARAAAAEVPAPEPAASTSRGDYSLARQLGLGISRIVIDPGHGGHDPGAQAHGVQEAVVVLDVAKRLEAMLQEHPGFEVVLTRRSDRFVELAERTAIANRESADMFISIHANASPRTATRGIETFFLDFATTERAEAVAARENASSPQTMALLPELVEAIALTNKVDESRELARAVQESLVRNLAGGNPDVQDLGVKQAPFVVLIGAQMPSILAEIAFVTNGTDAALLQRESHRQIIAEALLDAILEYRASLKNTLSEKALTASRQ